MNKLFKVDCLKIASLVAIAKSAKDVTGYVNIKANAKTASIVVGSGYRVLAKIAGIPCTEFEQGLYFKFQCSIFSGIVKGEDVEFELEDDLLVIRQGNVFMHSEKIVFTRQWRPEDVQFLEPVTLQVPNTTFTKAVDRFNDRVLLQIIDGSLKISEDESFHIVPIKNKVESDILLRVPVKELKLVKKIKGKDIFLTLEHGMPLMVTENDQFTPLVLYVAVFSE